MIACTSCGSEWPDDARFCGSCGAELGSTQCRACGRPVPPAARFCLSCGTPVTSPATPEASAAPAPEERRVVTILFVDLVGFTERSDRADPEDVRTTLVPFHTRVKEDIERYGGTLDKFIGDAAMGVFGAPVAHEDDPLRAVRAALRIVRSIDELREADPALAIRVAVHTGEAVVSPGSGPQIGEAVAGDVVNTASRMQALASPGDIVLGETTYRLVRGRVAAEAMPPASVKGKAEPIVVWRVLGEVEPASAARIATTRFIGRQHELDVLRRLVARVRETRAPHVATVTGEAGIGKSRLVDELRASLDAPMAWHEGACVPYGDAVTFAAVADVVRSLAGAGRDEAPAGVAMRLREMIEGGGIQSADAPGIVERLLPALGAAEGSGREVTPAEMGAALASILVLRDEPTVVAVHDLHAADDVVLDVLDATVHGLADRPVLLLATGRPELADRSAWPPAAAAAGATTVVLSPLSAVATETLIESLVADRAVDADARSTLVERAGGNPLFALEYVRMLADTAAATAVPETIQALLAARLDAVTEPERALLRDASVAGTEFWPRLLAETGRIPDPDVDAELMDLTRRGLVKPTRSTLDGWPAYAFTHDLIREVAYGRIPRHARARTHLAVGRWLETAAGDRANERAETLARHFSVAFELASAARDPELAEGARAPAVSWLLEAGRSALAADVRGAFAALDRAVSMAPPGSAERAEALTESGLAGRRSGLLSPADVLERHESAIEIRRALGDEVGRGGALVRASSQLAAMGRVDESRRALAEAIDVLEALPPGRDLANAYAHRAQEALFAGDVDAAMRDADRTIHLLGDDSADELVTMALHIRGDARCSLGEREGLDDLVRALELARTTGRSGDVVTSENYVGEWFWAFEGPAVAAPHFRNAIAIADRDGNVSQGVWAKAAVLPLLYELGLDTELLLLADEVLALGRDRLDATVWAFCHVHRSNVLLDRDQLDEVVDAGELLAQARAAEDVQAVAPSLLVAARIEQAHGRKAVAADHVRAFAEVTRDVAHEYRETALASAGRLCLALGLRDVLAATIEASDGAIPHHRCNLLSARACLAELDGEADTARAAYLVAADAWDRFGSPREASFAREGADRCSSLV